ncbi:MAG: hypothetical protein FD149_1744 [Rhodospirillaceae bacterium]|nr:MAG: hypothetical protein FD149_1744 [Rhodospirillaceae bacterium]
MLRAGRQTFGHQAGGRDAAGRQQHRHGRPPDFHGIDQGQEGEAFADAGGMQPHQRSRRSGPPWPSQPLAETGRVFLATEQTSPQVGANHRPPQARQPAVQQHKGCIPGGIGDIRGIGHAFPLNAAGRKGFSSSIVRKAAPDEVCALAGDTAIEALVCVSPVRKRDFTTPPARSALAPRWSMA